MDSPVVRAWMKNPIICNRASASSLCIVPRDYLSRTDIIRYHGVRPSISAIRAEVANFFHMARPVGKSAVKRSFAAF